MFIDTHCHLYLWKLNENKEEIINSFWEKWWKKIINIWVDIESSHKVIDISKEFENNVATIWIHPCYVMEQTKTINENIEILKEIYAQNKDLIVWIWEAWLDNYHLWEDKEKEKALQKEYFKAQIRLSKELNIPIIIHTREAWNETLEILRSEKCDNFIIHCYSEDLDFARQCMDISEKCVFAFWWVLTFPKSDKVKETAKHIPLERIVVETDAPYLAPQSKRWKLNKPENVRDIVEYLAELRWEDYDFVEKKVYENSVNFFNL